jgi:hypothetical protein
MKRTILLLALLASGCGALQGGTIGNGGAGPSVDPVYNFGIVACAAAVDVTQPCPDPVVGAKIEVQHSDGWVYRIANEDGYALMNASIPFSAVRITADGFLDFSASITPPSMAGKNFTYSLRRKVPPLPAPPTRFEILNVKLTFQGLHVQCDSYGDLPWFEAALPWLTPDCRTSAYAAKHASTAWPGGDTHVLINLPSGPALYDEPGQPYSADKFPALDWTNGGTFVDGRLAGLVVEAAQAGFNKQLLFLGGDDGERGFPIAMLQLDLVATALRSSTFGDLRGYVVVLPGWDGVFYGYSPEHVQQWGEKCRTLFIYCGVEHQPGRIPVGEGGSDYQPGGRMRWADLILAEFDGPLDSAWRTKRTLDAAGRPDYPGNQIWQIGARMLGPAYHPPVDQPADSDSSRPPFYLAPDSDRGPFVHCAFEWTGEYFFVRGQQTSEDQQRSREYFRSAGWSCGG